MGFNSWQMDNHLEYLQGKKLGDGRLWSGEKLQPSESQDCVSCRGFKNQHDLQSMRTSSQFPTFCYAQRKLKLCARIMKQFPSNNRYQKVVAALK